MKSSLQEGINRHFSFKIDPTKCVPALYPEADEFSTMPEVFATGFMVGLLEWTCIQALRPHLDWPAEQSVGTHIDVSHLAATPPGLTVTARVKLIEVDGRRLVFEVEAHDGVDTICRGRHERFIIDRGKFDLKLAQKMELA
jgi:fluoroacetyl-CoA thioesterase